MCASVYSLQKICRLQSSCRKLEVEKLCNGTELPVRRLMPNVIEADAAWRRRRRRRRRRRIYLSSFTKITITTKKDTLPGCQGGYTPINAGRLWQIIYNTERILTDLIPLIPTDIPFKIKQCFIKITLRYKSLLITVATQWLSVGFSTALLMQRHTQALISTQTTIQ